MSGLAVEGGSKCGIAVGWGSSRVGWAGRPAVVRYHMFGPYGLGRGRLVLQYPESSAWFSILS